MKCIKCSYTSFDFNQTCPKCGKDLSAEAEKLHLPFYKPNPPYLLTSFTGETGGFEHSLASEASGIPSFLENQDEEVFMLDKNRLDSSPDLEESSLNEGENELMVALDELSFEYEPAVERGFETPTSSGDEDLYMPKIPHKEKASSKEAVPFEAPITEDDSPFASMDEEEISSGIFETVGNPEAVENANDYLELDLSDIHQTEDQTEEDELLISLDDLSFDQDPVSSKDSPKEETAHEDVFTMSEMLDFNVEDSQAQPENLDDFMKLDLSDRIQTEDRKEDGDPLHLSPDPLLLEEDRLEEMLPTAEADEISLTPNMLSTEESASLEDTDMPALFSDKTVKKTTETRKSVKKKADPKNDFIELDLLEMEVDREDS